MSEEQGNMKIAGVYRVKEAIENLKISVKIVQQSSLLGEIFQSNDDTRDPNFLEAEQRIFSWQRKVFSPFESKLYSDHKNCLTETQKAYHRQITSKNIKGSRLYCCTKNDTYRPDENLLNVPYKSLLSLRNESAAPNIPNRKPFAERYDKRVLDDGTTIKTNHYLYTNKTCMYILADLSRIEDSTSISSQSPDSEILLCSITYDSVHRTLTVLPDFSGDDGHRYVVVNDSAVKYDYWIEHASKHEDQNSRGKNDSSSSIASEKQRTYNEATIYQEQLLLSPPNTLRIFLNMEIASARHFPYDGLYVSYYIDLPRHWLIHQEDKLSGRTQRSRIRDGKAHFAYVTDITLHRNFGNSFSNGFSARWPCLLLAVSSLDKWTRYRTEGYASLQLPMHPGSYKFNVPTWRATGNTIVDRLRRFFTGGGSYELEDITYCNIPTSQNSLTLDKSNLNIISSGSLDINMNFVHQSDASLSYPSRKNNNFQNDHTSELMRSVEDVFQRFKIARERMIQIGAGVEL